MPLHVMIAAAWIARNLGLTDNSVGHAERLVSGLGGFCGIVGVALVSSWWLEGAAAVLIMSSMGSSAVLLFAVPHGPLSQPWPLVGGHLISAAIGVAAVQWIPGTFLAAGVAVGLAIAAMYYLRCIHPPGGATAMFAVMGGESVHALGWQFVVTPALLNTLLILAVAIAFNAPFPWRRYPRSLARVRAKPPAARPAEGEEIGHADLAYALSEMETFLDVSETDLLRIYELATEHHRRKSLSPEAIRAWACYSNGRYGEEWSVREVTGLEVGGEPAEDTVRFKVVAGQGRRTTGAMSRLDFARWAAYEVERDENSWRRVGGEGEQAAR